VKLLSVGVLMLAGSLNCQTSAGSAGHSMGAGIPMGEVTTAKLEDVFRIERTITLQDGGAVITVLPVLTVQPTGDLFVFDPREHQVRRYDSLGGLTSYFGSRGGGPGAFIRLAGAVQLANGDVVTAETSGQIARFDARGKELERFTTDLAPLYNIALIDDSTVALAARKTGASDGPLVHIWDLRRRRLIRSFFQMPEHDPALESAYATGAVDVAVRGDTAAVTVALSDTVYLFTVRGDPVAKLPVPSRHFRRVARPLPSDVQQNPAALQEWTASFSRISKVFWAPDGSMYVQYFDLRLAEPEWNVVHMRRGGGPAVEVQGSPRLLAVSPSDSRLYFIHPQSDEPNVWAIGSPTSGF
jgi:hypothetical protein